MRGIGRAVFAVACLMFAFGTRVAGQVPEVETIERLLTLVEARYQAAPDPADVRAQAGRLDYDPQAKQAFVLEQIAYEPYAGSLRGASGTLLAGAGNALDQALLLRELLATAGVSARIVRRELTPEEAQVLLRLFLERGPLEADPPPQPEAVARELGVDPEVVKAVVRERTRREQALLEEVLDGAERETARLQHMLGERLETLAFEPAQWHYWVETADEAFDPTGSGLVLEGGQPVSEQMVREAGRTITFRLMLERTVGDDLQTEELLEVAFAVDEVAYRAVDLIVYPEPGELPPLSDLLVMSLRERAEAFHEASKFRCGLLVDGRAYGGAPFDRAGRVYDVTDDGRVDAVRGIGEGVTGMFGAISGPREEPGSVLRALRLEVVVQAAGTPERAYERVLFKAGEAGYPLLRDSFLVQTHLLPPGESARRQLGVLARNAPAIRGVLLGGAPREEPRPEAEVSALLLQFADLRRGLLASLNARPLHEGVGIVRESRQVLVDAEAGRTGVRHTIDLMDNALSFLTADGTYASATALHVGVADTALEWLLLVRRNPADAAADRSAWTLMERARLQGAEAAVLERGRELRVQWAEDAWWSIDRGTGHSVGRAEGGVGQAMVEYAWKASGAICQAMNPYFSLLKDLDVDAEALSEMEKLCSLRSILTDLGGDIEAVLDKGAEDFLRDKFKDEFKGRVSDMVKIREKLFDQIQAQTRALWIHAAEALAKL